MKTTIKYVAPWLAAAAIGASIALAPIASADTNPLVPNSSDPYIPHQLTQYPWSNDQVSTVNSTNGQLGLPS